MRKTISILLVFISFSCSNNISNKEQIMVNDTAIMQDYELELENVTLEKLISIKLLNYFELIKLKSKHPEFREGILEQLKDFSDSEFIKADGINDFTIHNIRNTGKSTIVSDSVQKMILHYDILIKNVVRTDSVIALIKTKTILLDGVPTKSTKIKFSAIK